MKIFFIVALFALSANAAGFWEKDLEAKEALKLKNAVKVEDVFPVQDAQTKKRQLFNDYYKTAGYVGQGYFDPILGHINSFHDSLDGILDLIIYYSIVIKNEASDSRLRALSDELARYLQYSKSFQVYNQNDERAMDFFKIVTRDYNSILKDYLPLYKSVGAYALYSQVEQVVAAVASMSSVSQQEAHTDYEK